MEDGWREVRSNGEKDLSSGEADEGRGVEGEERRTHATLHGARLLGKPGLLLFPPECGRADSQSGSSSIFAITTHKLVPKLPVEEETWREASRGAVWEYVFASPRIPPHRGVSECTSIKTVK